MNCIANYTLGVQSVCFCACLRQEEEVSEELQLANVFPQRLMGCLVPS